mmetsp:Transcript_15831/g.36313  ORF Transcript_15831/g.36313 Transcript_15831/m.36313 type:complete len:455 (+) Transcript_15831:123-1487(+)
MAEILPKYHRTIPSPLDSPHLNTVVRTKQWKAKKKMKHRVYFSPFLVGLLIAAHSWCAILPSRCFVQNAEAFTVGTILPMTTTAATTRAAHRVRDTMCIPTASPLPRTCLQSTLFGSIPFQEGSVSVTRGAIGECEEGERFNISYTLVRPMSLSASEQQQQIQQGAAAAPIVVLHGGPSLPSNYCYPLANHVPTNRSILFYDQLGCGKSDEPANLDYYSIDQAVDDLWVVLDALHVRRFHLYGHSYGGILAYEYLKRCAETRNGSNNNEPTRSNSNQTQCQCLSVILSSTPTSIPQMEKDWDAMAEALPDPNLFPETHLCRTPELPRPLQDAYAGVGTVWSGTSAISGYKARPPQEPRNHNDDGDGGTNKRSERQQNNNNNNNNIDIPSALILRGEHDVVTELCSKGWKEEMLSRSSRSVEEHTLDGCSHHGLLENGSVYGSVVDSFFGEYDAR